MTDPTTTALIQIRNGKTEKHKPWGQQVRHWIRFGRISWERKYPPAILDSDASTHDTSQIAYNHQDETFQKHSWRVLDYDGEDDVSGLSTGPRVLLKDPLRRLWRRKKSESPVPSSVPPEVFVPSHLANAETSRADDERLAALDQAVLQLLDHPDVEVRTRMQAIEQLALTMGAAQPYICAVLLKIPWSTSMSAG